MTKQLFMYVPERGWTQIEHQEPPADFVLDRRSKRQHLRMAQKRECGKCHQMRLASEFRFRHFDICNECLHEFQADETYTTNETR